MLPPESVLRREIVETGRKMVERGLVVATDGNISARLDDRRVLATPSGFSKAELKESDLVVCELDGTPVRGHRKPSSELGMHLEVYRGRPDARAVVHGHPPFATGFACAGVPLDEAVNAELVMGLGCVPVVPYATTGTDEMAAAIRPFLKTNEALLLSNHGAVVFGPDLRQAFWKLEMIEQLAKVVLVTRILGSKRLLGAEEVAKLMKARQAYFGLDELPAPTPGCPRTDG